jgi:hypothetical protein
MSQEDILSLPQEETPSLFPHEIISVSHVAFVLSDYISSAYITCTALNSVTGSYSSEAGFFPGLRDKFPQLSTQSSLSP